MHNVVNFLDVYFYYFLLQTPLPRTQYSWKIFLHFKLSHFCFAYTATAGGFNSRSGTKNTHQRWPVKVI